ncbi:MAG: NAD(P)-binding domain-containing protein [Nesterenkonia sp.]|nr:NAD(P)-binding domain-containing protein [Nesterenkonia sp.]
MSETSADAPGVVGVLGAGRAGTAFARALLKAGFEVDIAGTRPPKALRHHLKIYAPGARAVDADEVADRARGQERPLVILAVPQEDLDEVDTHWADGCVMVDATNAWHHEILPTWLQQAVDAGAPTSTAIAARFPGARTVKALNHIAHADFDEDVHPELPLDQRRAAGAAGDVDADRGLVMGMLDRIGFDPVSVGALADSRIMEPDGPLFDRRLRREDVLRRTG